MKYVIGELSTTLTRQVTLTIIILDANAIKFIDYLIFLYEKHVLHMKNKQIMFTRQYLFFPSFFHIISIPVIPLKFRTESMYRVKLDGSPAEGEQAAGEVSRK